MGLRKIIKTLANAVPLTATRVDYARFRLSHGPPGAGASPAADRLIAEVARNGYAKVECYWTRDKCERCIAEFEQLMREHPQHVHSYSDVRVFGAEELSPLIDDFYSDPLLGEISERYNGPTTVNAFTMANKVEPKPGSKGSGEGWHKDSSFRQFKAFIYLNDIGEENGPLQVVARSHTLDAYLADIKASKLPFRQLRIDEGQIARILAREPERLVTMTGKAGTLLLVDTASIHRGSPPVAEVRYALTNYYVEASEIGPEYVDVYRPVSPEKLLALRASRRRTAA